MTATTPSGATSKWAETWKGHFARTERIMRQNTRLIGTILETLKHEGYNFDWDATKSEKAIHDLRLRINSVCFNLYPAESPKKGDVNKTTRIDALILFNDIFCEMFSTQNAFLDFVDLCLTKIVSENSDLKKNVAELHAECTKQTQISRGLVHILRNKALLAKLEIDGDDDGDDERLEPFEDSVAIALAAINRG